MEYKAIVKRNDNTELYHSDSFLGMEFSDELYHFKYIRKEKMPSGKVKYYYKRSLADKFKFGYGYGSKEDSNTGSSLNKNAPNPVIYRKLANTTQEYADALNSPFYSGRDTAELRKEIRRAEEEAVEWETKAQMAKSFMTKLGYFVGRTINDVEYNVNKGKNRIKELIDKLK